MFHSFPRRLGAAFALASCLIGSALAQTSNQPLRLIVPFPAGGTADVLPRILAEKLRTHFPAGVVVENRTGAGGNIGAESVFRSAPDGTTLFLTHDHTISILPQVVKNAGFDPVRDFVPVGGFATFVNAFAVSGGTPAKSFGDYVNWVRTAGQGKGAVGIPAPASTPEFLVKLIGQKYQIDLVSAPYRGSAPMMADMLGNQISAGVASVQDFIENHKAGKVHVVAVLGTKRQAAMPDVPTFDEMGLKGFEDLPYYGIYAPTGTPQKFITDFSSALAKVVAQPDVRDHLTAMGLTVGHMSPQQLAAREKAYTEAWARIIKTSGFVAQ